MGKKQTRVGEHTRVDPRTGRTITVASHTRAVDTAGEQPPTATAAHIPTPLTLPAVSTLPREASLNSRGAHTLQDLLREKYRDWYPQPDDIAVTKTANPASAAQFGIDPISLRDDYTPRITRMLEAGDTPPPEVAGDIIRTMIAAHPSETQPSPETLYALLPHSNLTREELETIVDTHTPTAPLAHAIAQTRDPAALLERLHDRAEGIVAHAQAIAINYHENPLHQFETFPDVNPQLALDRQSSNEAIRAILSSPTMPPSWLNERASHLTLNLVEDAAPNRGHLHAILSNPALPPTMLETLERLPHPQIQDLLTAVACPYCGTKPGPHHAQYSQCPNKPSAVQAGDTLSLTGTLDSEHQTPPAHRGNPSSKPTPSQIDPSIVHEETLSRLAHDTKPAFSQYLGAAFSGATLDARTIQQAATHAATPTGQEAIAHILRPGVPQTIRDAIQRLQSHDGDVEVAAQLAGATAAAHFDQATATTYGGYTTGHLATSHATHAITAPTSRIDGSTLDHSLVSSRATITNTTLINSLAAEDSTIVGSELTDTHVGSGAAITGSHSTSATIAPKATLTRVNLETGVTIGGEAVIENSSLGENVRVHSHAIVRNTTIPAGTIIPSQADISEADDVRVLTHGQQIIARFTTKDHSFWKPAYTYSVSRFDATTGAIEAHIHTDPNQLGIQGKLLKQLKHARV